MERDKIQNFCPNIFARCKNIECFDKCEIHVEIIQKGRKRRNLGHMSVVPGGGDKGIRDAEAFSTKPR